MTRVTPQAAADLMGLMRLIADPDQTQKHLDDLVARHADLDTRKHALDAQEKDLLAAKAVVAGVSAENEKRQKALSDYEVALNKQAGDIEVRVRNHGVEVANHQRDLAAFDKIRSDAQDSLDAQRKDLAKREAEYQTKSELLDARATALDVREADVKQANDVLDERHRKLRQALA